MRFSVAWYLAVVAGLASCGLDKSGRESAASTGGDAGTQGVEDSGFGGGAGTGGAAGAGLGGDASLGGSAGAAGTGSGGVSPDAGLPDAGDAGGARVTDGLVLLYELDEGSGNKVGDSSAVKGPFDLSIQAGGQTAWGAGSLKITAESRISNPGSPKKLVDACKASNELTVEAWVTPGLAVQSGPARIAGCSLDAFNRNFSLMQSDGTWGARIRTTTSGMNGMPDFTLAPGIVKPVLTHVALTRAADSSTTLYVDGKAEGHANYGGDFSNWDYGYGVVLGNELTESRPWLGELHLVAVYCRALSAPEVAQNFAAGPG